MWVLFAELAPEEIISVMSCLVFQEKDAVPPVLTERLAHVRVVLLSFQLDSNSVRSIVL